MTSHHAVTGTTVQYPDSDGQPMADNTLQFQWIVLVKENLEALYRDRPDVFVAGDLLWYPVEGAPSIRRAPDALVVFGRPKGYRGSYKQWEEDGIAPQVVFEILSPGNTEREMATKQAFYDRYGVVEYYVYNPEPDVNELRVYVRDDGGLARVAVGEEWVSPLLGVRFVPGGDELRMYRPDGEPFVSFSELEEERAAERVAREHAEQRATSAEQERAAAAQRATLAERRAAQLEARLRALGIDPATLNGGA